MKGGLFISYERDFKGIWIPKEIWLSEELTLQEKVFLSEVDSLDNEDGCFANNQYFSHFFRMSKTRVSIILNSLVSKGYITSKIIYKEGTKEILNRVLKVCYRGYPTKVKYPYPTKVKYPIQQKFKDNNIIYNLKEEEETTQRVEVDKEVINKYKECISQKVSTAEIEILSELQQAMGKELVIKAIMLALMKNGKNLGYIKTVLMDWKNKGLKTSEDVELYLAKWVTSNQRAKENREKQVKRRADNKDYGKKVTTFNDYEQRTYDYDELEKKLLGYD